MYSRPDIGQGAGALVMGGAVEKYFAFFLF
jgi:hypothetical protein